MATLAELATFCQGHGWFNQTTAGIVALKQWINDVIQFLALERRWPFYETAGYLNTTVPYSTGTVDLTAASTTVVKKATADFDAGMAGQEFYTVEDRGHVYQIASVVATTDTLTLASAYLGATASGKTYEIRYVRYAAPADWGQEGVAKLEDGRDLNMDSISLMDWHTLRMMERQKDSYPQQLLHTTIGGTHYFLVHPAPSAAKQIRYTYHRIPPTITDSDSADMPAWFRGLLHQSLAARMATDNADAGLERLRGQEYQRMIDKAYAAQYPGRPISISLGGRRGTKIGINGLGGILQFTDPQV